MQTSQRQDFDSVDIVLNAVARLTDSLPTVHRLLDGTRNGLHILICVIPDSYQSHTHQRRRISTDSFVFVEIFREKLPGIYGAADSLHIIRNHFDTAL